jgi:hypothetical protein
VSDEGLARPSSRVQWIEPTQKAAQEAGAAAFQLNEAAEGTPIRHEGLLPAASSPPSSTSLDFFFFLAAFLPLSTPSPAGSPS